MNSGVIERKSDGELLSAQWDKPLISIYRTNGILRVLMMWTINSGVLTW